MDSQVKLNLIESAREIAARLNGFVSVRGSGNARHVTLTNYAGKSCVVWYPEESRVKDLELQDLKDAMKWIFGTDI